MLEAFGVFRFESYDKRSKYYRFQFQLTGAQKPVEKYTSLYRQLQTTESAGTSVSCLLCVSVGCWLQRVDRKCLLTQAPPRRLDQVAGIRSYQAT